MELKNVVVAPSLLSCDFLNIENELNKLNQIENIWLHLDVMDGHFVPNLTFGPPIISMIAKKSKCLLDAHFMVTNPEFYIEDLKDVNLHNFTFHYEAASDPLNLILKTKQYFSSAGISVKPNTAIQSLNDEILKAVDLVLVMSVEPGFGGQSFMPECLEKIKYLKAARTRLKASFNIQVDGGINDKNVGQVIEAGADNVVAGSFVFKGNEYAAQIDKLRMKK